MLATNDSRSEAKNEACGLEPGESKELVWIDVCAMDDVLPGAGAAALIEGEQIALVRTMDGVLYAISNFDPFSRAFVIARGIVGDRGGVPKIASPIYKQSFDLRTGVCLDDSNVRLPVYPVRVVAGRVQVCPVPRRVA
ncbi:MAG: nitrite reductase small subunit NirD [Pseudomonadota bacterium]|nr:MAG: nitrite reductase (NAD(P)H) small subunit [Pseudomonadota bacterium]